MAKCRVCGSEFSGSTCPFCGTAVVVEKKVAPKSKPEDAKPQMDPAKILSEIDAAKTSLVEKCRKSVVKVYCVLPKGMSTGSGFVIDGGLIVTNAHVVDPRGEKEFGLAVEYADVLKLGSLSRSEARLLYFSREDDIAILIPINRIPSAVPLLSLSNTPTKQGESVFTIGNPLHYKFTYMEGAVANPEYVKKNDKSKYSYVQTTLTLNHGNSGGPVYNTGGEVVGMSTFGELCINQDTNQLQEIAGYGFCVSAKAIKDAVKKITK